MWTEVVLVNGGTLGVARRTSTHISSTRSVWIQRMCAEVTGSEISKDLCLQNVDLIKYNSNKRDNAFIQEVGKLLSL